MKRGGCNFKRMSSSILRRALLGLLLAGLIAGSAATVALTQTDISAIVERVRPGS